MRGKGNMERLTVEYCGEYVPRELCSIDRLGGADDCDLCCEYCKATEEDTQDCTECAIGKCFNKLGEYENLEEQGKLLKLPCAVGDTVYEVQELRKRIQPYTIIVVQVSNCGNLYGWELKDGKGIYSNVHGFSEYAIGKQVFLTLEGAEAALKELKEVEVG